jgi:hypothetical protein
MRNENLERWPRGRGRLIHFAGGSYNSRDVSRDSRMIC